MHYGASVITRSTTRVRHKEGHIKNSWRGTEERLSCEPAGTRHTNSFMHRHQGLDRSTAPSSPCVFGPFSSVWTATIARVGAFFRIFRDLQDLHSFAPLRIQKFSENSSNLFMIFCANFAIFCYFSVKIVVFRTDFDEFLAEFDEM